MADADDSSDFLTQANNDEVEGLIEDELLVEVVDQQHPRVWSRESTSPTVRRHAQD